MVKVKFVSKSANSKTGNISQVYLDKSTCPNRCGMKDICYGKGYYTNRIWNQCNIDISSLSSVVRAKGSTHIVRIGICGDISHNNTEYIDITTLGYLEKAFKHNKAYLYTHCQINEYNIALAKQSKITINFSCDSFAQIDHSVPCVIVAESMSKKRTRKNGITFIKCPNSYDKSIKCENCRLCMNKHRKSVIVFPKHGVFKNKLHNGVIL